MLRESRKVERLRNTKFNPLADYKKQTKGNSRRIEKTIGDTSLGDDFRLELMGLNPDEKISFRDQGGDMNYGKLMVSATSRNIITSLSANTQKLFLWIIYELRFRSDIVELDLSKMMKLGFEMLPVTFRKSLKQLERNGIIKRVGVKQKDEDYHQFFINPQIIYKGNAWKYFTDVLRYHPEFLPKK